MIIDCDSCTARPRACGDCFVSFMTIPVGAPSAIDHAPDDHAGARSGSTSMDGDQHAAVQALAAGGLVPPLRLVRAS